ncbi:MAG: hypothetical protein IJ571_05780 [Ruminococcus sp.]|nr:hypothetical protein [Ruminococcus sp.]
MVRLFNIVNDDESIYCDYEPEKSGLFGKVVVDKVTEEIRSVSYSEYEYGKKMYVAHVRAKLCELLNLNGEIPKETVAIWF